jgi:hypothetical protein
MWSVTNMQIMPKVPIDYLPRVKLNFSNSSNLERADIFCGRLKEGGSDLKPSV